MRNYELVMILSPESNEEEQAATLDRVTRTIAEDGGTITDQENWGLRRMSYPIKKFKEANYLLAYLSMEPQTAKKLESSLNGAQDVLRHLLVKID